MHLVGTCEVKPADFRGEQVLVERGRCLRAGMSEAIGHFEQAVSRRDRFGCMAVAEHVPAEVDMRALLEQARELLGIGQAHGVPDHADFHIGEDVLRSGLEGREIFVAGEVVDVHVEHVVVDRHTARPAGFGAGAIGIVFARNDPDDLFSEVDVDMAQTQRFADPETGIVEQHDQERVARETARLDQPQDLAWRQALLEHLLLYTAGIARQIAVLAPRRATLADMLEERLVDPVPVIDLADLSRIDREVVGAVIEAVERFDRQLDLVARRWRQNPRFLLSQQDQPRARQGILSPGKPPGKEAVVERNRGFMDAGAVGAEEVREVDDMANIRADRVRRRVRLLEMDDPMT